jgi:hypothetical protein
MCSQAAGNFAQENAGKSPTAKKAEQKAARAAKAEASGTVRK